MDNLNIAGLFATPNAGASPTIKSVPWYYSTGTIPANFTSPYNPNPTLDALKHLIAPTLVIG